MQQGAEEPRSKEARKSKEKINHISELKLNLLSLEDGL